MKKTLALYILLCLPFFAAAQKNWQSELQREYIKIENGQYTTIESQRLTFKTGLSLTYQTSAIAPVSLISRDSFLSICNSISLFTVFGILTELDMTLDDVTFKEINLDPNSGDLQLKLNMTSRGLTISITTYGETEDQFMSWEEFFAEN